MRVWRIARAVHAAFDGEGGRLYGSRWTPRGVAAVFTSGSRLGRAVAMPPIGTAPCFRQTATRRRKTFVRKGVVLMSTPKRSGQTEAGSFISHPEPGRQFKGL